MKRYTNVVKNIYSIFAVVILLFSGICFNQIESGSVLVYPFSSSSTSTLSSGGSTLISSESCTLEMLGQDSHLTSDSSYRTTTNRMNSKTVLSYLLLDFLSMNPHFTVHEVSFLQYPEIYSITQTILYIHNGDGKK